MEQQKNRVNVPASIIVAAIILAGAVLFKEERGTESANTTAVLSAPARSAEAKLVLPLESLGQKLVSVGVLDTDAFLALYGGEQLDEARRLLLSEQPITMTKHNAPLVLNLLWGLGLGQKSPVLETGMMRSPRFGGAERFASTAGWSIANGDAMSHYAHHRLLKLSSEAERLVERVASGIYRPCCDNATHFPDCNHGMAMLGLLEILAADGADEERLFDAALIANRLWFPDQYALISDYEAFMREKGRPLSAKDLVGKTIASGSGFGKLAAQREQWGVPVQPQSGGGGGCSV